MEGTSDANSNDAVWNLLGRHSKVGRELFKLYYNGDARGADVGNQYSHRNLEAYRKKLAAGHVPSKPEPPSKPVAKSRAYVEVPPPSIPTPRDPWAAAQRPLGGKKPLEAIQRESHREFLQLEPKGPLLDEAEKSRLALHLEYAGRVPEALQKVWQSQQGRGAAQQETARGSQTKEELLKMFHELSANVQCKQAAIRAASSYGEADKYRREMKADLKHLQQLDGMLARLEPL